MSVATTPAAITARTNTESGTVTTQPIAQATPTENVVAAAVTPNYSLGSNADENPTLGGLIGGAPTSDEAANLAAGYEGTYEYTTPSGAQIEQLISGPNGPGGAGTVYYGDPYGGVAGSLAQIMAAEPQLFSAANTTTDSNPTGGTPSENTIIGPGSGTASPGSGSGSGSGAGTGNVQNGGIDPNVLALIAGLSGSGNSTPQPTAGGTTVIPSTIGSPAGSGPSLPITSAAGGTTSSSPVNPWVLGIVILVAVVAYLWWHHHLAVATGRGEAQGAAEASHGGGGENPLQKAGHWLHSVI